MNRKINLIKLLAQPYTIQILEALKKPSRYKDLKEVCKSDRTLAKRVRELQELMLIEPMALKEKGKYINFYKLTKKGEEVLRKIEKLKL
jgi:DNA-binding HxlR family transcriptional regulator